MPELGAVPAAAVSAFYFAGEDVDSAVPVFPGNPASHLTLNHLEGLRINDGFVIPFDIVLRNLAFVGLGLFRQEVHREALLQQDIAFVLLIGQDRFDDGRVPVLFTAGCRDAVAGQDLRNAVRRLALQEKGVDPSDDCCLRLIHHKIAVLALVVAKEAGVGDGHLAIRKTLALSPGAVLRNGAALFLGKAAHDGQEKLVFGIKCPYVFLFKIKLRPVFLQMPDGGEEVDRRVLRKC